MKKLEKTSYYYNVIKQWKKKNQTFSSSR